MTKNNKNITFQRIQEFVLSSLKECKIKTIVMFVFLVIAFFTGVIVAIRTHSDYGVIENWGIVDIKSGGISSTFFTRILSCFFIFLILFGCSFFDFLLPIAVVLISYRSYLLGLNICLMIIFYGFSSVLVSVIIALPCQLVILLLLAVFYISSSRVVKDVKCYGNSQFASSKLSICILFAILIFAVCLIETVLLFLFSAKVFLVL